MGGIIKRSEINNLEMYKIVRITMMELLKGYPAHLYWGIFEGRFDRGVGEEVVRILEEHKLIEVQNIQINNELKKAYRLTPKGISVAVSLAQLNYAEKMDTFTKVIIALTVAAIILSLLQIFIPLLLKVPLLNALNRVQINYTKQ